MLEDNILADFDIFSLELQYLELISFRPGLDLEVLSEYFSCCRLSLSWCLYLLNLVINPALNRSVDLNLVALLKVFTHH